MFIRPTPHIVVQKPCDMESKQWFQLKTPYLLASHFTLICKVEMMLLLTSSQAHWESEMRWSASCPIPGYWVLLADMSPPRPHSQVEAQTLRVTVYGPRAFRKVMKVKWGSKDGLSFNSTGIRIQRGRGAAGWLNGWATIYHWLRSWAGPGIKSRIWLPTGSRLLPAYVCASLSVSLMNK